MNMTIAPIQTQTSAPLTKKQQARMILKEIAVAHNLVPANLLHRNCPEFMPARRAMNDPSRDEFLGPRAVAPIRWKAFKRIREETGLSLTQIGDLLGGFDHTTVRHGILRAEQLLAVKDAA